MGWSSWGPCDHPSAVFGAETRRIFLGIFKPVNSVITITIPMKSVFYNNMTSIGRFGPHSFSRKFGEIWDTWPPGEGPPAQDCRGAAPLADTEALKEANAAWSMQCFTFSQSGSSERPPLKNRGGEVSSTLNDHSQPTSQTHLIMTWLV